MYNIIIRELIERKGVFTYSRSRGSGGQNVNKVNTKATLHLSLNELNFLSENEFKQLKAKLHNKINSNNEIVVSCEEERSQSRNKSILVNKTIILIESSIKRDKKRKKTKPTGASMKRRLEAKKRQSLKKEIRNFKAAY